MRCILLGTGGAVTSQKRHNTSLFIEKNSARLLVDCNGICIQKLDENHISFESLEHIFLTHRHIDHIGALGNFMHQVWLKSCYFKPAGEKRENPLHFYGHTETIAAVKNLFAALDVSDHPDMFEIIFHSIEEDGGVIEIETESFEYFPVKHSVPCYGLKTDGTAQSLIYSGDTQICPPIYQKLKDQDVLIHECNAIGDIKVSSGHTTWHELEILLKELPDVRLYLVHLPTMTEDEEQSFRSLLNSEYNGKVILPEDGIVIDFN